MKSKRKRFCNRVKLRPAIIDSLLLFNALILTDAWSSTKAPASSRTLIHVDVLEGHL
jgi:hypothetical protein